MSILSSLSAGFGGARSQSLLNNLNHYLAYAVNLAHPNDLPSIEEMYDAWRAGLVNNDDIWQCLRAKGVTQSGMQFRDHGAHLFPERGARGFPGMWAAVLDQRCGKPDFSSLVGMLNQGLIDETKFEDLAHQVGWWQKARRDEIVKLSRNVMPHPAELVSMALRDVWDQNVVDRYEYDAEFPPQLGYWMERAGFNADAREVINGQPQGNMVRWPRLFWRAHWRAISPTQAYEMFQRLRPGRIARYRDQFPDVRPFVKADLEQVLKINDFPKPFRDQIAAIAYHKPRLVDIDRFFSIGAIDANEAYELHLDLGYAPPDARQRVAWLQIERTARPRDPETKKAVRSVIDLYKVGILRRDEAEDKIGQLYGRRRREEFANGQLPEGQAAVNQEANRAAARLLEGVDLQEQAARAKELRRAWRAQYLDGQMNADELRVDMLNAGFTGDGIELFIARLDVQLASGKLMLSTEKIRRLTIQGIMPFETARRYLQNLGWKEPELSFILQELTRSIELEAERAAEREARDNASREASQLRQVRLLNRQRGERVRALNRQASPAQLLRYFTRGVITENDYERELRRREFDDAEIKRLIESARHDRARYLLNRKEQDAAALVAGHRRSEAIGPPVAEEDE